MSRYYLICIFAALVMFEAVPGAACTKDRAAAFIEALLSEDTDLTPFVDPEELRLSGRLGIQYRGITNKFLISYDIDSAVKEILRSKRASYDIRVIGLAGGYCQVEFVVPTGDYHRYFYFKGDYLVSPVAYHTKDWARRESEYFNFILSDPALFNDYCIANLDRFVSRVTKFFSFEPKEIEKLKSRKVYYILCKDEDEIARLTGYKTRGIYIVAYDYVITTFNAHYHELVHQLLNYKLRDLHLYVHPFFLEGLATAVGGRGGKEPGVILGLGLFMARSGMLDYENLLSSEEFFQVDTSFSYPLSGLYNRFLLEQIGVEDYLRLYRKYSGEAQQVNKIVIEEEDLPGKTQWRRFIGVFENNGNIELSGGPPESSLIHESDTATIYDNADRYFFSIEDTLLVPGKSAQGYFRSKLFSEVFSTRRYGNQKYLIIAGREEISIYNLYTNNLIAKYVSGFSSTGEPVPCREGRFEFSVSKGVFDEDLEDNLRR